jgi:hypothetical protein
LKRSRKGLCLKIKIANGIHVKSGSRYAAKPIFRKKPAPIWSGIQKSGITGQNMSVSMASISFIRT